jgi:hypothetical protein
MCTICGDSGYRPAVRYGVGCGTGGGAVLWADHAVMEPCSCNIWNWPNFLQSIYFDLRGQQEPLGEDFEKVLHDNAFDLYAR